MYDFFGLCCDSDSIIDFVAELITVGWGKKETQFHGTEGKPTSADLKPKVLCLASNFTSYARFSSFCISFLCWVSKLKMYESW